MNELAVLPKKLALPEDYRQFVTMPPVLVNDKKNRRYTMTLNNGLNILVDTFDDNQIEFRAMPKDEARFIRVHSATDINDPKSYVCKVNSPAEFVRALLKFTQIKPEKVAKLDRAIGLRISENNAFLRPFLATDPIYTGNETTYVFEFPNGYTPVVKSHNDGTFDLLVQVDDGRGSVDFYDIGFGLLRERGMKKLVRIANQNVMELLYQIFSLPKYEVQSTIYDEMTKEYWDELDRKLEADVAIDQTDIVGYMNDRFNSNLNDLMHEVRN